MYVPDKHIGPYKTKNTKQIFKNAGIENIGKSQYYLHEVSMNVAAFIH